MKINQLNLRGGKRGEKEKHREKQKLNNTQNRKTSVPLPIKESEILTFPGDTSQG